MVYFSDLLLKWSKKDGFSRQGFSQTFNTSPFGKLRKTIISGQYDTRLYCDQVSSVKFDGSKPILFVSKCMLFLSDLLLKWSKKDGFTRQGFSQTFITSLFGRFRKTIIRDYIETRLYCDKVSSVKIYGSIEFKLEIHHFSRKLEKWWCPFIFEQRSVAVYTILFLTPYSK